MNFVIKFNMRHFKRTPFRPSFSSGFTLVELAIALMVIGLLIAGVLKGQELVENARVVTLVRQIDASKTALTIFRNTYDAIPGDIKNPQQRIPNCNTAPCNVPGNGDKKITGSGGNEEIMNFWLHMAKANLISGVNMDVDGTDYLATSPESPYGGQLYVQNVTLSAPWPVFTANVAGISDYYTGQPVISVSVAAQTDRKMDDGKPYTGDVLGFNAEPTCLVSGAYNEVVKTPACVLMIRLP